MRILVIDVGGSHVKILASGQETPLRFPSGSDLTPATMIEQVLKLTPDWQFDAVTIGLPTPIGPDGPETEPGNLGNGWVGFDFQKAFGGPVRVINDAALQALGSYEGGRMLFLGLGTGLGSALVTDWVVIPLELGCLPYCSEETIADRVGKKGLERNGEEIWKRDVLWIIDRLREACSADYVGLGGGHAELIDPLPENVRRCGTEAAFQGGLLVWEEQVIPHDSPWLHRLASGPLISEEQCTIWRWPPITTERSRTTASSTRIL